MKLEKVLLLTENVLKVNILQKQFEHWNIQTNIAQPTSGVPEALTSTCYDLVMIHQEMHGISSSDAASRVIKSLKGKDVPLMLLAEPRDIATLNTNDRSIFRSILPLPINHSMLRNALNEIFEPHIPRPAGMDNAAVALPEASSPLNILVAEDNLMSQVLIKKLLENIGHKVDLVADGCKAVDACRAKAYHLVFMDLQMPEMDGVEASILINNQVPSPPVIIALTASNADEDRQLCLNAGMKDFLQKPVSQNEIREKVEIWNAPGGEIIYLR